MNMERMIDDDAVWDFLVDSIPPATDSRRPGATVECPSLPRFVVGTEQEWKGFEAERDHVLSCSYCQNTLSLSFRSACPSLWTIIHSEAFGEDAAALRLHIGRDECLRCRKVRQSRF